jgi:hypothetical protein
MVGTYVFQLTGFDVTEDKIYYSFVDHETPRGHVNRYPFFFFEMKYGITFEKARSNFINFKGRLDKIDIKLTKKVKNE